MYEVRGEQSKRDARAVQSLRAVRLVRGDPARVPLLPDAGHVAGVNPTPTIASQ